MTRKQETGVRRVIATDDYYGWRMPVPSEFTNNLMSSIDERWAVLEAIGIERRPEVTPLVAWRDACADEMGIPREKLDPQKGGSFDLGFTPMYVRKWVLYLA